MSFGRGRGKPANLEQKDSRQGEEDLSKQKNPKIVDSNKPQYGLISRQGDGRLKERGHQLNLYSEICSYLARDSYSEKRDQLDEDLEAFNPARPNHLTFQLDKKEKLGSLFRQLREGIISSHPQLGNLSNDDGNLGNVKSNNNKAAGLEGFVLHVFGTSAEFNLITGNAGELIKSLGFIEGYFLGNDFQKETSADDRWLMGVDRKRYLMTFYSYFLLYQTCVVQNGSEFLKFLTKILAKDPESKNNPEIAFAIEVQKSISLGNYSAFFALRKRGDLYQTKILDFVLESFRIRTLTILKRAYLKMNIPDLTKVTGFENEKEAVEFGVKHGCFLAEWLDDHSNFVSFRPPKS